MGHWCRICERMRPNETFTGKGHARHICKQCSELSGLERREINDIRFLADLLDQKRISPKNMKMLKTIQENYTGTMEETARVLIQVAKIRPCRKKRLGYLYHNHRPLFDRLVNLGLIVDGGIPLIAADIAKDVWDESFASDDAGIDDDFDDMDFDNDVLKSDFDDYMDDDLPC